MQTDLFSKCVKILRTLLTVSKFAKSIQYKNLNEALKMEYMTSDDQQFIMKMVSLLVEM